MRPPKKVTGTSEVSADRNAVATAAGVGMGATATWAAAVGVAAIGEAAPAEVPLGVASAAQSFVASLFGW